MYDVESRREFLRQALLAGTATATARLYARPAPVMARPRSPNERLNIGCIGVAAQGAYNMNNVASQNIVALSGRRLRAFSSRPPSNSRRPSSIPISAGCWTRRGSMPWSIATPDHSHRSPPVMGPEARVARLLREAADAHGPRRPASWRTRRPQHKARHPDGHADSRGQLIIAGWSRSSKPGTGASGRCTRPCLSKSNGITPGKRVKQSTPPAHVELRLVARCRAVSAV